MEEVNIKQSGIWVPQNFSELKKKYQRNLSVYGLPMFHLFYSKSEKYKKDWSIGKIDGKNNMLHAFRIIVGITWNWLMSNLAGYQISKYDLAGTITSLCYIAANKDKSISSTHWHDILNVNPYDKQYCEFLTMKTEMESLKEHCFTSEKELTETLRGYFMERIAKYVANKNDRAITMFTPLSVQKEYKDMYGKNAVKAYRAEHQEFYTCYIDLTSDFSSYIIQYEPSVIKTNCWLTAKTIQRLLSKQGKTRNYNKITIATDTARSATVGGRKRSFNELPKPADSPELDSLLKV